MDGLAAVMDARPNHPTAIGRWRGIGRIGVPRALRRLLARRAVLRIPFAELEDRGEVPPGQRVAALVAGGADPGDIVAAAYEAFQREIHSFVVQSTRDPEVAADITQEAFLRLLREVGDARTPDNVRAWLYRVATNLVINRAKHVAVVDRVRRAWRRDEETFESPEATSLRAERHEDLRLALGGLSADARLGLLLAAQGFSGREVAAAIGRTEPATRTLLCRARLQLRSTLTEGSGEGAGLTS